jgi:putative IMPACT (imprinted ancient) family translation regulator
MAINDAKLLEYKDMIERKISTDYTHIRQLEYECENIGVDILDKEFSDSVIYKLKAPKEEMEKLLRKIDRLISIYP